MHKQQLPKQAFATCYWQYVREASLHALYIAPVNSTLRLSKVLMTSLYKVNVFIYSCTHFTQ